MLQLIIWTLFCVVALPNLGNVPTYSHIADCLLVSLGGSAIYAGGWVYYKFRSQVLTPFYPFVYGRIIWPLTPLVIILDELKFVSHSMLAMFTVISVILGLFLGNKNFQIFENVFQANENDLRIMNSITTKSDVYIFDFLYWGAMGIFFIRVYVF